MALLIEVQLLVTSNRCMPGAFTPQKSNLLSVASAALLALP